MLLDWCLQDICSRDELLMQIEAGGQKRGLKFLIDRTAGSFMSFRT